MLVALDTDSSLDPIDVRLEELAELAATAGARTVSRVGQRRKHPDPATLIGAGKIDELIDEVADKIPSVVIFDDELSPTQQRNLGEALKVRVIDRTQLILDIFAKRARTREGKLQVELAQLSYLLPRLGSLYTKFERQQGGIGVRGGGGETKLELDRRKVRERIADLERELEDVKRKRRLQREGRRVLPFPTAALVGYTSAGKSTLLNLLTGADVLADRMLFSTLDPTTRRVVLPDGRGILLTDTVGFIRNLPHHLVAAFRATLEEVVEADFLVHVVDASSSESDRHRDTVEETIESLGGGGKPVITVYNKADLVEDHYLLRRWVAERPNSCYISAAKAEGIPHLMDCITETIRGLVRNVHLKIPYDRSELVAQCYEYGVVHSVDYAEDGILVRADVAESLAGRLLAFDANPAPPPFWEKTVSN